MINKEVRKGIYRDLYRFLIPTFILTYGVALIGYFLGGLDTFPVMAISMYIPATIVLLLYVLKFRKKIFKHNDLGLKFKGFKFWIIAPIFLFIIITAI